MKEVFERSFVFVYEHGGVMSREPPPPPPPPIAYFNFQFPIFPFSEIDGGLLTSSAFLPIQVKNSSTNSKSKEGLRVCKRWPSSTYI